jgi:nicotinamide-nucleotide amidase
MSTTTDIELITIGDEIITGHTVDTNAAFMASALIDAGFTVRYRSSVGDVTDDIEAALRLALSRADIVISTGGLGPTDDDLTKRAIVKVFKRNLIFHEDILEEIKARYARRGIEMPAINQNQALLPQGATIFPNRNGSAVGICLTEDARTFIALPGVPYEMRQIMQDEVIPHLIKRSGRQTIHVSKLRTTGIAESRIAELIKPNLKLENGVRLAYLPTYRGVDLRIVATGETGYEASQKARALELYLDKVVGKYVYGRDTDTIEGIIGQLLLDNDKMLSVAESCTAGLLGAALTSQPGSSRYFLGGVIAYDNAVKVAQLGVDSAIMDTDGAVSEACVLAMARGCRDLLGSDYALAITGIAGPDGGTDVKPVGTVWIGLAAAHANTARLFQMSGEREVIRERAVYAALEYLRRDILDIS